MSRTTKFECNLIDFSTPIVIGVLNITTDSFYDGGKYLTSNEIINRVKKIHKEGAKIIDIGACSSKPGSTPISEKKEIEILLNAIKIVKECKRELIISTDTFRSKVAEICVKNGAHIINDISAGELDVNMLKTIIRLNVPYIMMHMKGKPINMQENPKYLNIINDINSYFEKKIKILEAGGFNKIILDPGLGFGKTLEHNYQIIQNIQNIHSLKYPILIGASRKSMIYNLLKTNADQALNGTTVINTMSLLKGAKFLRVHDVKEAIECVKIIEFSKKIIK